MTSQPQQRRAEIVRETAETSIRCQLNLDGTGSNEFATAIPFFDHMLHHLVRHSGIDLELEVNGDLEIDSHHSVEDSAIVMGQALREALGEKRGLTRYGHSVLPMDETLVTVAVDLGGRFHFRHSGCEALNQTDFNNYAGELTLEFLEKFAMHAMINLHVVLHYGHNRHHQHEAIFKALGRALGMAIAIDPRLGEAIASTKGSI